MSYCVCPQLPEEKQRKLLEQFIASLNGDVLNWNLLELQKMFHNIQPAITVQEFKDLIKDTIPFRGMVCPRSLKCCAQCVRQCRYRCIQDCLNRAYMWKKALINQPKNLALSMAVASIEAANNLEVISWVVGDMLSQKTNTPLKEYMTNAGLRPEENPYKLDYAPQSEVRISEKTGKAHKIVADESGAYRIRAWPDSGLCPFCLPARTHTRKIPRGGSRGTGQS